MTADDTQDRDLSATDTNAGQNPPEDEDGQIGASESSLGLSVEASPALDMAEVVAQIAATGSVTNATIGDLFLADLPQQANFVNCRIDRLVARRQPIVHRPVFKNCVIDKLALSNATLEKGVTFEFCDIESSTTVQKLVVRESFKIRNCRFAKKMLFNGCEFHGDVDGWDSRFVLWTDFKHCHFHGNADFRSAEFAEGLVMQRCVFGRDVLMRGASVTKKFSLEESTLRGCLDLQKAKLHDYTYLQDLKFDAGSCLRLWNCIARALLVKPAQIEGRLAAEQAGDFACAAEEYGILKNNYGTLNWLDEEDWAYYLFKRTRLRARKQAETGLKAKVVRGVEHLVFDLGCRYGTDPVRVLLTSLVIIFFFAAVYCLPLVFYGVPDSVLGEVAPVGLTLKTYHLTNLPVVDSVLTALIDSTSAFVSGFDGVDKNVDGWLAIALTIEGLFGMLLLGLFIVSFSRKVIR